MPGQKSPRTILFSFYILQLYLPVLCIKPTLPICKCKTSHLLNIHFFGAELSPQKSSSWHAAEWKQHSLGGTFVWDQQIWLAAGAQVNGFRKICPIHWQTAAAAHNPRTAWKRYTWREQKAPILLKLGHCHCLKGIKAWGRTSFCLFMTNFFTLMGCYRLWIGF